MRRPMDRCGPGSICIIIVLAAALALLSGTGCLPEPYGVGQPDSLLSEFILVWDLVDAHYGGFVIRTSVDWDAAYSSRIGTATSAGDWDAIRAVMLSMLGDLEDSQLYLLDAEGDEYKSHDGGFVNWDLGVWQEYMVEWELPDELSVFDFNPIPQTMDSVGYGYVSDLGAEFNFMPFFSATMSISGCSRLIIDLRMLSSGTEGNAQLAIGRFVAEKTLAYWRSFREGPGREDMSELTAVEAIKNGSWQFTGQTFVLVGRGTRGTGEQLAMLLATQEHVVLVGDTTSGYAGPESLFNLTGGWTLALSEMLVYTPELVPVLGIGLAPDEYVETTEVDFLAGIDPVLDRALEMAGE